MLCHNGKLPPSEHSLTHNNCYTCTPHTRTCIYMHTHTHTYTYTPLGLVPTQVILLAVQQPFPQKHRGKRRSVRTLLGCDDVDFCHRICRCVTTSYCHIRLLPLLPHTKHVYIYIYIIYTHQTQHGLFHAHKFSLIYIYIYILLV